jgi:hypothetical protein
MPRIAVQVTEMRVDAWDFFSQKGWEVGIVIGEALVTAYAWLQGLAPAFRVKLPPIPVNPAEGAASFSVDLQRLFQGVQPVSHPTARYVY